MLAKWSGCAGFTKYADWLTRWVNTSPVRIVSSPVGTNGPLVNTAWRLVSCKIWIL